MPYGFKLGGLSNRRGSWEPLMAFQEEAYGAWALEFTVQAGMKRFCYSVAKWYLTLWDTKDCSTPGFPVLHRLTEFSQELKCKKNKNNFVTNADVYIRDRIKNECDYETIEKVERRIRGVSLDVRHYLLGQSLYLCIIFLIDENCNLSYISWGLSIAHHFFQQYIRVYMYVYMLACINYV